MGVLDDKVAIVTGSARGIGRATAELLSSQGAKVLINDLDADVAEQTASEIAGDTVVYGGDLTADGAADELVKTAIDAFGKIDIIVNNAGYTLDAPIHKMTDDWWEKMLAIHVTVPFKVIRAAAPARMVVAARWWHDLADLGVLRLARGMGELGRRERT